MPCWNARALPATPSLKAEDWWVSWQLALCGATVIFYSSGLDRRSRPLVPRFPALRCHCLCWRWPTVSPRTLLIREATERHVWADWRSCRGSHRCASKRARHAGWGL